MKRMTEQELREQLWFTCDKVKKGEYTNSEAVYDITEAYKQAGYVRLAEDQSMPKSSEEWGENEHWEGYEACYEDMLNNNFRKIEKEG